MWRSVLYADSAFTACASFTRTAFITFRPLRRAASAQYEGPSSPWNWSIVSGTLPSVASTSSSGAFTNTPATSQRRRCAVAISAAVSTSTRRGLSSKKIIPIAHAPLDTARSASSGRVRPQIFTFAGMRPIVEAAAASSSPQSA